MADKRISQLIERTDIANNDVLPIVASGATTTNKVTVSTLQDWMQDNLDVGVTSVGITIGSTGTDINVSGSPITTSGNITINIPTASATNRGLLSSANWTTFNNKLSSVGLTMPSAFTVSNSPLTANGTIAVTGAGTVAQYIRGDGSLADFPEAGGGGASVSYYLNGSVSQGTIGGVAYYEMNKTPILGAGTDFTISSNGYIASFITDAGDPALLEIPAGNWNFETYLQASSGGGSPTFYIELYKVSAAGTATLIATSSGTPELIAFGTTITPYFSALAVPTTTLALTDRLALRYYVTPAGRTITLHTENSHLCQIITTFTTGLTALNGLTAQVQNLATGTSGSDFNIVSSGTTHTFNLPDASASNRGVVTTGTQTFAGYKIFNGTIGANVDIQLATVGTALNTFLKNINSTGLTSIGSNGFGFNNANNIYFSGSSKGGGVFAFSNSGTQTYTLQDASGTLAFTSQIPTNPVGGTGTTNQIPKFTASSTIGNSNLSDDGSAVTCSTELRVLGALNGTTASLTSTGTHLSLIRSTFNTFTFAVGTASGISGLLIGNNTAGTTPLIINQSNGAATFSNQITSGSWINTPNAVGLAGRNAANTAFRTLLSLNSSNQIEIGRDTDISAIILGTASATNALSIASTGAATFSSDVNAGTGFQGRYTRIFEASAQRGGLYPYNIISGAGTDYSIGLFSESSLWFAAGGGITKHLTIASTGAATFSSSVTTGGDVLLEFATNRRIGVDLNSGEYFYGISSNSNARQTRVISAAADGNLGISFETGNTYTTVTPKMTITSSGNVGIGTASPAYLLDIQSTSATLRIRNTTAPATGGTSSLLFEGINNFSGTSQSFINSIQAGNSGSTQLVFGTSGTSDATATERMRITSGGALLVSTQSSSGIATGSSVNQGVDIGGGVISIQTNNNSNNYWSKATGYTSGDFTAHFVNGNYVGGISTNGSTTTYAIASDYRLKEDFQEINGIEKVQAIKVYDYKWKESEDRMDGVIAHELQEVLPYAVVGEKDAERMQSVDYSKIVPILIKAIQELKAEIDSLKNQIK
jgi:hypothetical protein